MGPPLCQETAGFRTADVIFLCLKFKTICEKVRGDCVECLTYEQKNLFLLSESWEVEQNWIVITPFR